MMNASVLGVSAGNGVMLYPFKKHLSGNIEIRKDYLIGRSPHQFHLNFPSTGFYQSLADYQRNPHANFNPDIIIGHPKCGNSSVFALSRGKKFTTSKSEPSLTVFLNSIQLFKPKLWVMENLPKLLETLSVKDIEELFDYRYELKIFDGSVSAFGNSQVSRKRLLIVGMDKLFFCPKEISGFVFPSDKTSYFLEDTEELLENLPDNGNITEDMDNIITLYAGFKIRLKDMQKFWLDNPSLKHYPIKGGNMSTAPGVYINRANAFPMTVRKTNRQFNPKGIQMSPRELARIQGIPDDFKIFDDFEMFNKTTLINKGRVTVANTPPMDISIWLYHRFKKLFNS